MLFGFWSERPLPPAFARPLEGTATIIGAGNVMSDAFKSRASDIHIIVAGAGTKYDNLLIGGVPNLKVIVRTGIGVDNIDLAAATAHGVAICNIPDAPTISTAEHAILLMFAVTKHLKRIDSNLKMGTRNNLFSEHKAITLAGAQLGIVGLGRIGSHVAKSAKGLGMIVAAYDAWVPAHRFEELDVEQKATLGALLGTSDVVTLHVPSTPETHHLINTERLAQMKSGSYLINTARGSLVDEAALYIALESGHLHGAGLDVFDPEPPNADNPLLHRDDVVATPHVGGITVASRAQFWSEAIAQSLQVLKGERPPHLVNTEVWPLAT